MYIVIILKILIMTEPNESQNAETSREAFCRLVNQRIDKVTKSLENLSRLSSRGVRYLICSKCNRSINKHTFDQKIECMLKICEVHI